MKNMILKRALVMGSALALLGIGYLFGSDSTLDAKDSDDVKNESSQSESTSSQTIAIINLDEGVTKNKELTNYGSTLTNVLSGVDIKVTGLEDGRQGIESGAYGAYIIIPNTFSENIETVSSTPIRSSISYAIATSLGGEEREEVIEQVRYIYDTFADSISQVYLSSILKDYHKVQDEASALMARDTKDTETLNSISGYDLIEIVSIPEILTVENNVTTADLSSGFEKNSSLVGSIDQAYLGFLSAGQSDYDSIIKTSSQEAQDALSNTSTAMATLNTTVTGLGGSYNDTALAKIEDDAYAKSKNNLLGVYGTDPAITADGILVAHKDTLDTSNDYVKDRIHEYTSIEGWYYGVTFSAFAGQTPSNTYPETTGEPATVDEYLYYTESNYNDLLVEYQNLYSLYAKLEYDYDKLGGEIYAATGAYGSYAPRAAYPAISGDAPSSIAFIRYDKAITFDDTKLTKTDTLLTDVESEIDDIISTATSGRATRVSSFNTSIGTIGTDVAALNTAYADQSTKQTNLNSNIGSFNVLSHVDSGVISSYVGEMEATTSEMSAQVSEQNSQYGEYVSKVYETTSENISNLQTAIRDGQDASNDKLESGLATAKASRTESNSLNLSTLEGFTYKLPYTRIGELQNKEVYTFIANPFSLENVSSASTGLQTESASIVPGNNVIKAVAGNSNTLQFVIIGIIAIVILAIAAYMISLQKKRRKNRL